MLELWFKHCVQKRERDKSKGLSEKIMDFSETVTRFGTIVTSVVRARLRHPGHSHLKTDRILKTFKSLSEQRRKEIISSILLNAYGPLRGCSRIINAESFAHFQAFVVMAREETAKLVGFGFPRECTVRQRSSRPQSEGKSPCRSDIRTLSSDGYVSTDSN